MLEGAVDFIEERAREMHDLAEQITKDAAIFGRDRMIRILEAAHTQTGRDRVAQGGNGPGRVDSGKMRDEISAEAHKTSEGAVGRFGWIDEVLDYFIYQEFGEDLFNVRFEGMKALQGAYLAAREQMLDDMQAAGIRVI